MAWHYQIRRRIVQGTKQYDIVEVYPDKDGKGRSWTTSGMRPNGLSRKETIHDVELMFSDIRRYPTLIDEGVY